MAGNRFKAEAQRSLAAASILAGYTAIGTPFANPEQVFLCQNLTDALLQFSFDGVVDHFVLPANSGIIIDVCANQTSSAGGLFMTVGTQMYVKRIGTPSTGSVYVSVDYSA